MAWRVGGRGLRVIHPDGSETLLPPGSVIREIPGRFDGSLELVREPEAGEYDDAAILYGDLERK